MKAYPLLICTLACAFSMPSVEAAAKKNALVSETVATTPGPKVRVLLEKDIKSALLEVKGPFAVVRKDSAAILSTGSTGKRFVVHALQDGLRWGEEYPDCFSISVIPSSPTTMMYVDGIQYKGAISIYHCRDNRVTIVNDVPIEEFLKSTLTMEIDEPVSREALAAVVITERTAVFAKAKAGHTTKRPWDITAKETNYLGYSVRCEKDWIESAVDATKFMVLEQGDNPYPDVKLSASAAEELASRGLDAKKILQTSFPRATLSVNSLPKTVAVR